MTSRSLPLDLLRTLAIFLVFASHFRNIAHDLYFGKLAEFGWVGVDLFFVLSGFLISTQLFREIARTGGVSWREFYLRRGFRIWPNFFFVLALYALFPAIAERSQLAPLWRYLTFTLNFGLDYGTEGAFSHAWSLCVEEQFYLILPPLLVFLAPRLDGKRATALTLALFAFGLWVRGHEWHRWQDRFHYALRSRYYFTGFFKHVYYPTYCRLDSLTAGVAIAAFLQYCPRQWERARRYGNLYLITAAAFLAAAYSITQEEMSLSSARFGYLLAALAFGFLLLAALCPSGLLSKFRGRWAMWSANLAFAFYLTHKSVIHHSSKWLLDQGLDPGCVLYPLLILGACTAVALVLFHGVEKPFLKWRDRLLHASSLHFVKPSAASEARPLS